MYMLVLRGLYRHRKGPVSWRVIEDIAECYACVVKLGGRMPRGNKPRPAHLTVKGVHVTECFFAVVRASRLSFKGNPEVKFNSTTVVPISNSFPSFVLISY